MPPRFDWDASSLPRTRTIFNMRDHEKLGQFYLGRLKDSEQKLHYDAKDLVTHAVCVGMTGSGKTGLCVSLIEEAALDGIPALVIDPKGDLTNLLLAFPELRPEDFRPWVNPDEARLKGLEVDEFAAQQAALWQKGLGQWDRDGGAVGGQDREGVVGRGQGGRVGRDDPAADQGSRSAVPGRCGRVAGGRYGDRDHGDAGGEGQEDRHQRAADCAGVEVAAGKGESCAARVYGTIG